MAIRAPDGANKLEEETNLHLTRFDICEIFASPPTVAIFLVPYTEESLRRPSA